LDSNVIRDLLRPEKNPQILERYAQAKQAGSEFTLCPVVYYEVRRGLEKTQATVQLGVFEQLISSWQWRDFERACWGLAALAWSERERAGRPIGDADLLIGIHAKANGATLVTENVGHFDSLGVAVENWRASSL
jgi:tRNA(fMet)-specific endonuclease VapC